MNRITNGSYFFCTPHTDVYIAEMPAGELDAGEIARVYPAERAKEIAACTNEGVRRQKYFVWQLLACGLERTLGRRIEELQIIKSGGKWQCPECGFSLSHSGNAVCAAISYGGVGVDLERVKKTAAGFADKILNVGERAELDGLPEGERDNFLITKWTQKESLFKRCGGVCGGVFTPSATDTAGASVVSYNVSIGGERYVLSVACDSPDNVRVLTVTL